jgi:hypothetical protein
MAILLRPVRPEDVEAIHALRLQPSVLAGTLALPSERIDDCRRFVGSAGPDDHLLVAEVDGLVIGPRFLP